MTSDAGSKTQEWFRHYSAQLETTYRASALFSHSTTKGETRESQILDVLEKVLPRRVTTVRRPVIIDSEDRESRSFDGAIADLHDYPRLLTLDATVLMVESVRCVVEVKSSLNGETIRDAFAKAESFRSLNPQRDQEIKPAGLIVTFAYACDNINLRFLDYTVASRKNRSGYINLMCALSRGVFGYRSQWGGLERGPSSDTAPCLVESAEDSLLLFIYHVIRWLEWHSPRAAEFAGYSNSLIHRIEPRTFDADFLDLVCSDDESLRRAREAMRGMGGVPFTEAYSRAKAAI